MKNNITFTTDRVTEIHVLLKHLLATHDEEVREVGGGEGADRDRDRIVATLTVVEDKLRDAIGVVEEEPKPNKQHRPQNDGLDSLRELLSW